MERVFAVSSAVLLGGEGLTTARTVAGGTLVVAAMFPVEPPPRAGSKDALKRDVPDEVRS